MKTTAPFAGSVLLVFIVSAGVCLAQEPNARGKYIWAHLQSFAAAKEKQAQTLADPIDVNLAPTLFQPFYSAIRDGNWESVSNKYYHMRYLVNADGETFHKSWWQPILETFGAEEQLKLGKDKYFALYANDIIGSIPPGSIYFGGTDPARFIISAMQKSQINGDPFFTLTQNALADETYLDYLRSMYGDQIYVPTQGESRKCYNDYYADAAQRVKRDGRLDPGEEVTNDPVTGKMMVGGQVGVMNINALIAKVVVDQNTNRDFYIEESFPLKWMYPYLEPHSLIFKLNHKPLAELTDKMVQRDRNFWTNTVSPMIGDWLTDDTKVADVAAFAEKVYLEQDFSGFGGDPAFVENANSQQMFSKERAASAGLYAWRADHADNPAEKNRMNRAADFAFRQAWALCPDSPEAIFRYVQYLMSANRVDDAIIVARTGLEIDPLNAQISGLLKHLQDFKREAGNKPNQNQVEAMKEEAARNPEDYKNIFALAGYYFQMQQTNRASELLLQVVSRPDAPPDVLEGAAKFFAQTRDFINLEITLKKLAAKFNAPEVWYDLSRLEVMLGENDEAIKNLQEAIDLSDQRLKTNPSALDIRNATRAESQFNPIRNEPAFRKLVGQ